ncbi:hypothetical protein [Actinomadura sp. WMMA1423]|uniref:hypothetical protein n=1 Tax=Actinomadura sp. WMMA1423 TaxID=2591108 RepID=UPI001146CCCB|nr:hypothetical protein [Actinomadura sp. WMMA1423]
MPKERLDSSTGHLESIVMVVASELQTERPTQASGNFANAVYLGDECVYKFVRLLADESPDSSKEARARTLIPQRNLRSQNQTEFSSGTALGGKSHRFLKGNDCLLHESELR